MGRAFDGFEQRGHERCQLAPGLLATHPIELAQVDRQLVEQNQRRLATEQLAQRFAARRTDSLVAAPHSIEAGRPRELVGEFAPRCTGKNAGRHLPAVERI